MSILLYVWLPSELPDNIIYIHRKIRVNSKGIKEYHLYRLVMNTGSDGMDESINVLGEPLVVCGEDPATGYYRDGLCNTCNEDVGSHTVCVEVSKEFLEFSRFRGNDLSTPAPQFGFPGLRPGDCWCLCAARWLEAHEHKMAPRIYLTRTHVRALEVVALEILRPYAVDLN